jgi:hypothetical protein
MEKVRSKSFVVLMTIVVLLYPVMFALLYFGALAIMPPPSVWKFAVGPIEINGTQNVLFVLTGALVLIANLIFAIIVQNHLWHAHENVQKTVAKIRGFAAAGGAEANRDIDKALNSYGYLLSWRYLFSYVGPISLFFYTLFLLLGVVAAMGGFKDVVPLYAPQIQVLAWWVLGYYVVAMLVRELLRLLIGDLLRDAD